MKNIPTALVSTSLGLLSHLQGEELSPTLEVLPINSTLSDVVLPRYDENRNRIAYLKADLMEILADGPSIGDRQPIMVDCTNIKLRMSGQGGPENLKETIEKLGGHLAVDMKKARYRLNSGVLTAQETITTRSPMFEVTGNGGIFHLDSHRGFLFGPLDCYISPKAFASTHPNSTPMIHSLTSFLAMSHLIAAAPNFQPVTPKELLEVEQKAKSSQMKISKDQKDITRQSDSYDKKSETADKALDSFVGDVESESLERLIQNPPASQKAVQAKPPLENPELTIHCDGGCFFDGNESLLVLLRDVIVKEARFTLKAQEEVKVFFLAELEDEKEKKAPKEAAEKKDSKLKLGDVESLVATGGVHFSGIDEKGNPVEASAATAFYNHQTSTLILKGGKPTFWTKDGKLEIHMQAENPDANVRVKFSEDAVRVDTSEDGWTLGGNNLPINKK